MFYNVYKPGKTNRDQRVPLSLEIPLIEMQEIISCFKYGLGKNRNQVNRFFQPLWNHRYKRFWNDPGNCEVVFVPLFPVAILKLVLNCNFSLFVIL